MPVGFTDEEKEEIQKRLIGKGRELLGLYGLKKTTIKDITEAAGIAQGSFYKFFDSKEEFYFEILELEEQKIREELSQKLDFVENNPGPGIKKLLLEAYELLEENDLLKDLLSGNSYDVLVRKLPEKKIEEHIEMDFAEITPLIQEWQDEGILKEVKPEAITGLLHALFLITLHKDEIGESIYNDTFDLLIDLIVDGLVKEEG